MHTVNKKRVETVRDVRWIEQDHKPKDKMIPQMSANHQAPEAGEPWAPNQKRVREDSTTMDQTRGPAPRLLASIEAFQTTAEQVLANPDDIDTEEPINYRKARASPQASEWDDAMKDELASLGRKWDLDPSPSTPFSPRSWWKMGL